MLLGLGKSAKNSSLEMRDLPVSKLFFDTFSKRVGEVEGRIQALSADLEKSRASTDRMQVSDLVLLERIQKSELVVKESLESIRRVIETFSPGTFGGTERIEMTHVAEHVRQAPPAQSASVQQALDTGILSGLNTPTELQVVSLLNEQGSKTAPEIGRVLGRSREHTARLLKKLYEEGYVKRDQARIPFRYSLVERVRASLRKEEKQESEETATAAAPQS